MRIRPEAKFWDVRFSKPETKQYKQSDGSVKEFTHAKNVHLMVVAESAGKVSELVLAEYPEATIHQINHRGGDCGIIVQAELLANDCLMAENPDLLKTLRSLMDSHEAYAALRKPRDEWDDYDSMMFPRWRAAKELLDRFTNQEPSTKN